jgi:hypothetical protein
MPKNKLKIRIFNQNNFCYLNNMGIKKAFTVNIDENISKQFSLWVIERGYTKYRAIEGALRAFMSLSPIEQSRWMFQNNNSEHKIQPSIPKTIREVLKNLAQKAKEQKEDIIEMPGTLIQIAQADLDKLIKELGPEPQIKKKTL